MKELQVTNYRGTPGPIPISHIATADVELLANATNEELSMCIEDDESVESVREAARIDLIRRAMGL